ncbi:hypothetical protein ACS0TY_018483 [Phlomoides rotata]
MVGSRRGDNAPSLNATSHISQMPMHKGRNGRGFPAVEDLKAVLSNEMNTPSHRRLLTESMLDNSPSIDIPQGCVDAQLQFGFMLIALIWEFDFASFIVLIIDILNDGKIFRL